MRNITENGEYYGYPKCCIDHFSKRNIMVDITKEQSLVHNGTGFIPCPECSKKIIDGKDNLEGLISNRICNIEFPNAV